MCGVVSRAVPSPPPPPPTPSVVPPPPPGRVPAAHSAPPRDRWDIAAPAILLAVGAVVLVAMAWRGSLPLLAFSAMGDTHEYLDPAAILRTGTLPATPRTLGYPAFLAIVGAPGPTLGPLVAQLALLGWAVWELQRSARRLAPDAPAWAHRGAALLIGAICLGFSLTLMSDFLCAVAVYRCVDGGLRGRSAAALGWGVAAALIRPTWAVAPPLFVALALLDGRKVWWLAAAGLTLGLTLSVAHQQVGSGYLGPSRVLEWNLQDFADRASTEGELSGSEAPAPDRRTLGGFIRLAAGEPVTYLAQAAGTSLRYVFAPVERLPHILWQMEKWPGPVSTRAEALARSAASPLPQSVRAVLFLGTLPVLALLLWPAPGPRRDRWTIPVVLVVFAVLVSSITVHQGERMRLPALLLLSGNASMNLARLFAGRRLPWARSAAQRSADGARPG